MRLLVKDWAKNKMVLVGEVRGDKLIKRVEHEHHFMVNENGYGISADGMLQLVEWRVKIIRIIEEDTKNIFEIPVKTWDEKGVIKNYGHGSQVFLNMKYYKLIKNKRETPLQEITLDGRLAMSRAYKSWKEKEKARLTIDK